MSFVLSLQRHRHVYIIVCCCFFSHSFDWPEKKKRIKSVQSMCTTKKFQANNWAHRMTFKNKQIWILSVFKCHRKHHSGPKQSIRTLSCMCRSCITVNPVVQASIFNSFNSIWVWDGFFSSVSSFFEYNIGSRLTRTGIERANIQNIYTHTHFKLPQFSW